MLTPFSGQGKMGAVNGAFLKAETSELKTSGYE